MLAVPDRSTLEGKRGYVIFALLVGCALRRRELAFLYTDDSQMGEGRWVIAALCGKGGSIRTTGRPHRSDDQHKPIQIRSSIPKTGFTRVV